jgi:hypothetical protein
MPTIRKALITEFGDESKITIVEGDIPGPSAEEVQVEVEFPFRARTSICAAARILSEESAAYSWLRLSAGAC